MEKQERRCCRLVLVPFPFQGHINPMLQLGSILHSKDFSITVAHTQFNSPDASSHPDFVFLPLSDRSSSKPKLSDVFIAFISYLNSNCRDQLQEVMNQIIEEQNQLDEFPCIIYDGLMSFAEVVARHLKLPSIVLRTSSATNFLTYYAYPRFQKEGYIPFQDSKLLDIVPGLYPIRFQDLPLSDFKNLEPLLQAVTTLLSIGTSTAIIWYSVECLEQLSLAQLQRQCQVPIFSLGPMHKIAPPSSSSLLKEDTDCITWLNKYTRNSVIYTSLGSIVLMNKKERRGNGLGHSQQQSTFLVGS